MTQKQLQAILAEGGVENAPWESRLLFCHVTGQTAAQLLAEPDAEGDTQALLSLARRRIENEPLQYILGEWGFYQEVYAVRPGVLIPRSDTELLVEKAIRLLPKDCRFADFCTGSGCVAISVLRHRPDLTAAAFDISPIAVALAKENAEKNGVAHRLTVEECDLKKARFPKGSFAAILSNPPYIPNETVKTLAPDVQKEPALALMGGEDGMDFYRLFLQSHACALKEEGFFLFEIGYDQKEAITALGSNHGMRTEVYPDIEGRPRCALLR